VIKVGGSLLDLPDLAGRLTDFLADFARPHPLMVCGGGPTVDLIRQWDRQFDLGEETSHWISVRALTVNALVLARAVPRLRYTESLDELRGIWSTGEVPVYDAYTFLRQVDESGPHPLPRRWRVTSDSIACRLAAHLEAPEVILLKSATVPEGITYEEAARQGLVDPHFPTVAQEVPRVVIVNLREESPVEMVLSPGR
jgi:aspartokinase-like uncharacterized kinase